MITSLIEVLESPNFEYMTKFTIRFDLRDNMLLMTSWTEIMTSTSFTSKYLYFRKF